MEKLTRDKALQITLELWTHLEETGGGLKEKIEWPGWDEYGNCGGCALCCYDTQMLDEDKDDTDCDYCPYHQRFGDCCDRGQPLSHWNKAQTKRTRKKYASIIVSQIKEIIND